MTPAQMLFVLAVMVAVTGLVYGIAVLRGYGATTTQTTPEAKRAAARNRVRIGQQQLLRLTAGIAVFAFSGWVAGGVAAYAAAAILPNLFSGARNSARNLAEAEALAQWTRRLSDIMASGVAGSVEDGIRRSQPNAPQLIKPAVTRLANRIGPKGPEAALRLFAEEVADPSAGQVAGVLILRIRNGGAGLADALTNLANDLTDRAQSQREVEAERAKPRSTMRLVVALTFAVEIAAIIGSRHYLRFYTAYSTLDGQIVLAVILAGQFYCLRWMQRLDQPTVATQVLATPPAAAREVNA